MCCNSVWLLIGYKLRFHGIDAKCLADAVAVRYALSTNVGCDIRQGSGCDHCQGQKVVLSDGEQRYDVPLSDQLAASSLTRTWRPR